MIVRVMKESWWHDIVMIDGLLNAMAIVEELQGAAFKY